MKEKVNNQQLRAPSGEEFLYYLHFRNDSKSTGEDHINNEMGSMYDKNNYYQHYYPHSHSSTSPTVDVIRMGAGTKVIHTPNAKNMVQTPSIITLPITFPQMEEHNPARDSPEISQDQLFEQAEWLTVPNECKKRLEETNTVNPFANFNVALFAHNMFPLNDKDDQSNNSIEFPDPLQCSEHKKNHSINDEIVPQSMEEIYQLSNQNRKRNKEKKKLKEDTNGNPIPSICPPNDSSSFDEADSSRNEEGKGSESSKEDTQEFLRKIGWISSNNNVETFDRDPKHRRSKSTATNKEDANKDHPNSPSMVPKNNSKKYSKPKLKSKTFPIYDYNHQKNYEERGYSHSNSRGFVPHNNNNNNNNNNNSNTSNVSNMSNPMNTSGNNLNNTTYNNNAPAGRGNRNIRGKPRTNNNQVYKVANSNYNNGYNYYNNNPTAYYGGNPKGNKYQGPQG